MAGVASHEPDMTRTSALLLSFSLFVVAGCAVAPRAGPAAGADEDAATRAEGADRLEGVRFTFRTGAAIRTRPLVVAGTVYVGSADGNVYAIDAKTGAERWRHTTGGAVVSSAAAGDGTVLVASRDGQLYCFDGRDGTVRWRYRFGAELGAQNYWDHVLSSPVVQAGRVYIGGGDGLLVALDAASGAVLWRHDAGARIRSTPAVQGDVVVFATMSGHVVALDARDGRQRWRFATDGAAHAFADKGNDTTSVFASPTIAGALVTIGARDGQLYALELATGRLAWRTTHDGSSWILSTAYDGGTLYVGSGSALIVQAADPATGAERWRFKTQGAVFSSIAIANDTLLFSDFAGVLYAIDRRSGKSRWQYPLGSRSFATPAVADGVVYAASDSGVLVALSVARGSADAPRAAPRRIVYFEGAKSPAAYGWFRNGVELAVLGQLKGAGYEQMDAAALAAFMAATTPASAPSVVVFADNKIPAELGDTSARAGADPQVSGGGRQGRAARAEPGHLPGRCEDRRARGHRPRRAREGVRRPLSGAEHRRRLLRQSADARRAVDGLAQPGRRLPRRRSARAGRALHRAGDRRVRQGERLAAGLWRPARCGAAAAHAAAPGNDRSLRGAGRDRVRRRLVRRGRRSPATSSRVSPPAPASA